MTNDLEPNSSTSRLDRLSALFGEDYERRDTVINVFVGAISVRASDADWDACLKTTRKVVEGLKPSHD